MYFVLLLWLWRIAYIKTFERLIELWLNGVKTFFFIKIKATLLIVGRAWIDDSNNEQNTIFGVVQEKKNPQMMTLKSLYPRLLLLQPKTSQTLNYLLLRTKSKSLWNRRNSRKQSLKKLKEKLEFILVFLKKLQQLRSLLQSIVNTLSTE